MDIFSHNPNILHERLASYFAQDMKDKPFYMTEAYRWAEDEIKLYMVFEALEKLVDHEAFIDISFRTDTDNPISVVYTYKATLDGETSEEQVSYESWERSPEAPSDMPNGQKWVELLDDVLDKMAFMQGWAMFDGQPLMFFWRTFSKDERPMSIFSEENPETFAVISQYLLECNIPSPNPSGKNFKI